MCGSGCIDYIFWCNWLLFTLGSNWLLDCKICCRCYLFFFLGEVTTMLLQLYYQTRSTKSEIS
ncbi:hypothetical protein QJS04_geneDACA007570 [Acorus gramineus]|uniref:Uncharacterized protein n=1 Tax=Acorus gramineus TaxID=55184 RepID=A0AAV9B6L2_ACOGR|nr:hypothetical protein QJS04_geneDACA007570 [Acorus gramineus]